MRSSTDWEAVTTPDATFLGIALVARVARAGLRVPGGTHSGSSSSSKPITSRAVRAIDFYAVTMKHDRPGDGSS